MQTEVRSRSLKRCRSETTNIYVVYIAYDIDNIFHFIYYFTSTGDPLLRVGSVLRVFPPNLLRVGGASSQNITEKGILRRVSLSVSIFKVSK